MHRSSAAAFLLAFVMCAVGRAEVHSKLLFYLSADKGTTADVAAPGTAEPTFVSEVSKIDDGAKGPGLMCGDYQRLAWWAPGNIYAQRGTLSFFWRSRYPVGPTEFPIFRVAFADHSSWDMAWLRIDYNGHGFDAFVTDASLARTRVSVKLDNFPKPSEWTHLTLSWDETKGIRFYVNGKLAAKNETPGVYNVGLDQFGPHSRIISPHQVQSDYNFTRGGDIDEISTYDAMLSDDTIAALARGEKPKNETLPFIRSLNDQATREEWATRYGWNRPNDQPPELPAGKNIAIRKVEIHDAYDLKRWWWKANDGIRETTWPGVYNRSRLPGRHDYFTLPDWDCYVDSGKAVTFAMPDEPWTHLEISGAAWGKMELLPKNTENETAYQAKAESVLFERPKDQEKTVNVLKQPITGRKIRFTNVEQEEPIGELSAYNVTEGTEPAGSAKRTFRLTATYRVHLNPTAQATVEPLQKFIESRYPTDERAMLIGNPGLYEGGDGVEPDSLPITHIVLPNTWDDLSDGLDGIAIDLPRPSKRGPLAVNIRVKDPLWPMRDMLDFTFTLQDSDKKTLWLDLRDRILPKEKPLYLTITASDDRFSLSGSEVRVIFKPREAARAEHELDRFTQARDTYAMLVEEHPNGPKLNMWVRFKGDLDDLLRVNPDHVLGKQYAAAAVFGSPRPKFTQPEPPAGVPLWAFRQTELLGYVQRFVEWYIDHRQVEFGDFGGGISDDVDLTNTWPGVAFMGANPEKLRDSVHRLLDAAFKNGMFTNGLPTIQADELHSYEEGINCLAQNLILDYGSPLQIERAMTTARGVESITGINSAGHRHIRSSYYSGTKMAEDGPWGWAKPYSYLVCQVPQLLVDYNGNPTAKKYLVELADGLLAHRHTDENGRPYSAIAIHFSDDREGDYGRGTFPWHIYWAAWKWTGEQRYINPILESGSTMSVNANVLDLLDLRKDWATRNAPPEGGRRPGAVSSTDFRPGNRAAGFRNSSSEHFGWQVDGDKSHLERLYAQQIENCAVNEYIETDGSLWIDRVGVPFTELQRARLGGVALVRGSLYPGHVVSWNFAAPATGKSVAILIPSATATQFKVIAYNLETTPVQATMTGWNIDPGQWEITQGIDSNNDDTADGTVATRMETFERSRSLEFTLPPRTTTVLTLALKTPGTPYWQRPDLGIDAQDVAVKGRTVNVTVHSLGSVAAPANEVAVRDTTGKIVARTKIPALEAPVDLKPRTTQVSLTLPRGVTHGSVELDPEHVLTEITARNNAVKF